ncbi:hypothetical protein HK405_008752, partial [Cladochytrium tenue]
HLKPHEHAEVDHTAPVSPVDIAHSGPRHLPPAVSPVIDPTAPITYVDPAHDGARIAESLLPLHFEPFTLSPRPPAHPHEPHAPHAPHAPSHLDPALAGPRHLPPHDHALVDHTAPVSPVDIAHSGPRHLPAHPVPAEPIDRSNITFVDPKTSGPRRHP